MATDSRSLAIIDTSFAGVAPYRKKSGICRIMCLGPERRPTRGVGPRCAASWRLTGPRRRSLEIPTMPTAPSTSPAHRSVDATGRALPITEEQIRARACRSGLGKGVDGLKSIRLDSCHRRRPNHCAAEAIPGAGVIDADEEPTQNGIEKEGRDGHRLLPARGGGEDL